jgi:hypothetical protein
MTGSRTIPALHMGSDLRDVGAIGEVDSKGSRIGSFALRF